jgi:hypothetical protein
MGGIHACRPKVVVVVVCVCVCAFNVNGHSLFCKFIAVRVIKHRIKKLNPKTI